MKFCPYCGADLLKEDAAFCVECGKQLSAAEEAPSQAHEASYQHSVQPNEQKAPRKGSKTRKKPKQKKEKVPLPEIEGEPVDDGYDGYYNDVLPPDLDREKEGLDNELIKKISALVIAVILIIGLCVVMMYVL